jgi:hypothetical protein
METKQLAKSFTALCAEGKFDEAGAKFWSDDIISREPVPGEAAVAKGRAAVKGKGDWWAANHEVHGVKVEGPFVSGDQFVVRYTMDVTPKGEARRTMDEVGVFTVEDGKITDESFFYAS